MRVEPPDGVETYDQMRAAEQQKESTSRKRTQGGIIGVVRFDRQSPRKYDHMQQAERSEKHEQDLEKQNDEKFQVLQQKKR